MKIKAILLSFKLSLRCLSPGWINNKEHIVAVTDILLHRNVGLSVEFGFRAWKEYVYHMWFRNQTDKFSDRDLYFDTKSSFQTVKWHAKRQSFLVLLCQATNSTQCRMLNSEICYLLDFTHFWLRNFNWMILFVGIIMLYIYNKQTQVDPNCFYPLPNRKLELEIYSTFTL